MIFLIGTQRARKPFPYWSTQVFNIIMLHCIAWLYDCHHDVEDHYDSIHSCKNSALEPLARTWRLSTPRRNPSVSEASCKISARSWPMPRPESVPPFSSIHPPSRQDVAFFHFRRTLPWRRSSSCSAANSPRRNANGRLRTPSWRARLPNWGLRWNPSWRSCRTSWTPSWVWSWRSPPTGSCWRVKRTGRWPPPHSNLS